MSCEWCREKSYGFFIPFMWWWREGEEEEISYPSPRGSGQGSSIEILEVITRRLVSHAAHAMDLVSHLGLVEQKESRLERWQGNKRVLPRSAPCTPTIWSYL